MAGRRGRGAGGIAGLVQLIERHRGAFEYDWRTRFGLPLSAVPEFMDWGEALRLVKILGADPSSQIGAAVSGWEFAATWEYLAIADLIDLQRVRTKWRKKPGPYRRPWDKKPTVHGRHSAVSVEQWKAMKQRREGGEH